MRRDLPLTDVTGRSFGYALPDEVLRGVETVNRHLSGQIGASALVTNENTRDRYIVSSLIEEAITSSQLEGAATTRQVAKEMLRTGRKPRTHDERMIVNNFHAMRRIGELRHTPQSRTRLRNPPDRHRGYPGEPGLGRTLPTPWRATRARLGQLR
nr:hypothetical protein GCM10020093_049220 [Planobispora longispora]